MMGQQQAGAVAEKDVMRSVLRRTMLALMTAALVVAMLAALAADPASAKNSQDRIKISSSGHILNSSHDNTSTTVDRRAADPHKWSMKSTQPPVTISSRLKSAHPRATITSIGSAIAEWIAPASNQIGRTHKQSLGQRSTRESGSTFPPALFHIL
jgi:hypothetical protein